MPWAIPLTGGEERWNTLFRLRDLGLKLIKHIDGHAVYSKCAISIGKTGVSGAPRLNYNLVKSGLIVITKQG